LFKKKNGNGKFLDAHFRGSIAINGSRRDFNLGVDVFFADPFAKSYENLSPDEVLLSKEDLKKLKYQNFATGSGIVSLREQLKCLCDRLRNC